MSGRKSNLYKFLCINAGSLSGNLISSPTNIEFLDNIGYQINATTSDAVGTFTIQVSADYNQDAQGNVTNAGNWIDLVMSSAFTLAGANAVFGGHIQQISFPWIRLIYTRTSGTGTVNAYVTGKVI